MGKVSHNASAIINFFFFFCSLTDCRDNDNMNSMPAVDRATAMMNKKVEAGGLGDMMGDQMLSVKKSSVNVNHLHTLAEVQGLAKLNALAKTETKNANGIKVKMKKQAVKMKKQAVKMKKALAKKKKKKKKEKEEEKKRK